MSAEQTPDIAAVLAEHVLRDTDPACSCGWDWDPSEVILPSEVDFDPKRYRLSGDVRPQQHRAHVAEALAPVLAAAVRDAEQRAFVAGWFAHAWNPERLVVDDAWHAYVRNTSPRNGLSRSAEVSPRADRVAVDAPEGGEGR